jgi:diguanylate cyclase (GGDEF)-like protein
MIKNENTVKFFLSQLPLPAAYFNPAGEVVFLNSAFTKLLGYTTIDIPTVECHWKHFFPDAAYREKVQKKWVHMLDESSKTGLPIQPMLLDIVAKSGEIKKLEVHSLQLGKLAVTMWIDFTAQIQAEQELDKLAHFDFLTGLPNRTLFFERYEIARCLSRRYDQKLAILFIDLDGFKVINDTLGHDAGDIVLKEVANRLLKSIREIDTVARFGGDEFALLVNDVKNEKNAALIADKILVILSEPFIINGDKYNISASIGITISSEDISSDINSMIKQSDIAMYAVKQSGKNNYLFFSP